MVIGILLNCEQSNPFRSHGSFSYNENGQSQKINFLYTSSLNSLSELRARLDKEIFFQEKAINKTLLIPKGRKSPAYKQAFAEKRRLESIKKQIAENSYKKRFFTKLAKTLITEKTRKNNENSKGVQVKSNNLIVFNY